MFFRKRALRTIETTPTVLLIIPFEVGGRSVLEMKEIGVSLSFALLNESPKGVLRHFPEIKGNLGFRAVGIDWLRGVFPPAQPTMLTMLYV